MEQSQDDVHAIRNFGNVHIGVDGCEGALVPIESHGGSVNDAEEYAEKEVTSGTPNSDENSSNGKATDGLLRVQSNILHKSETSLELKRKALDGEGEEQGHHGHHGHHGPAPKSPSILTAFAAAVINFLLMFGLCCAYGLIMFEDEWNAQHRGLGVKMNLSTALLVGLALAFFSKVPVAIGGPDLNPVVFLGIFIGTIAEDLAKQNNLTYPDTGSRRLFEVEECVSSAPFEFLRQLGAKGGNNVEFCTGGHLLAHQEDCLNYHAELRATTIFTVALSSAILGILFYLLGNFKLTRYVSYVPANIMEAFLSCVGYKVFKYALKFCKYEPQQFIPAACIGVPLYFVKALHIGNPAVVIPIMLLVPLGIFYVILFATGGSIDSARNAGWFFGELENADFWALWKDSLNLDNLNSGGNFAQNINLKAWSKTLTDLPIMIIVCLLDCLLKLSSTESKLPVKAPKDYEIKLYGISNLFTTFFGSSVGYMQLKFNVINFGVMGNVTDRRGGILYALFCGACFFWKTDLFNYLPRFFLSTLLFFAGSGFVAENLWGSRKYLSTAEWLQIFFILAVFIVTGSLVYAVIVGGLLASAQFIFRYSQIPTMKGRPFMGDEVVPVERSSLLMQRTIRHMSRSQLMVIRLKGFVFFASAQKMTDWLGRKFEAEKEVPLFKRVKWVIFDCADLDGMDSSALKAMAKLRGLAHASHMQIMWTSMQESFRCQLQKMNIIEQECEWFETFEEAVQVTDAIIADNVACIQKRWEQIEPNFEIAHKLACERNRFDPFKYVLPLDVQRFGCPWQFCEKISFKAFETVLWRPHVRCVDLLLIQSGKVGVFKNIPSRNGLSSCSHPFVTYTHGWFLNRQALLHGPTRDYGVALEDGEALVWTESQWSKMARARPSMAAAIMQAVLRQQAVDMDLMETAKGVTDPPETDHDEPQKQVPAEASIPPLKRSRFSFSGDVDLLLAVQQPSVEDRRDDGRELQEKGHELQETTRRLMIAQALDESGFFAPVPATEECNMPPIPSHVTEDIDVAFDTYATAGSSGPAIPTRLVPEALRYAGLYNVALLEIQKKALSRPEFSSLCLRSLLAPLSRAKADAFKDQFRKHHSGQPASVKMDPSGDTIDRGELVGLFKDIFKFDIPAHHIDGIANIWGASLGDRIDVNSSIAVMSRFIQRHMVDWCILEGVRKLTGNEHVNAGDTITADMLTEAQPSLPLEKAQEMIWAADFMSDRAGRADREEIDFTALALVLNATSDRPAVLPPLPTITGAPNEFVTEMDDGWTRAVVMDFRNPMPWTPPAKPTSKKQQPKNFDEEAVSTDGGTPDTWQARLLLLLDHPESSRAANCVSVFMGIMILVSVLTLVVEPLITPPNEPISDTEKHVWYFFEVFFTAIFTVEYLLNFAVCNALGTQTHLQFLREPMRICDIVAVLPFYLDLAVDADQKESRLFRIARYWRLGRLARLVRLGRLAKRSAMFAPIAMCLVVIWGIYMKNGLKE